MSIISFSMSAAAFISIKMFPILLNVLDLHVCMMIYGLSSIGATIFIFFFLKETSGQCIDGVGEDEGTKVARLRTVTTNVVEKEI